MDVELRPGSPVTDDASRATTGKTLREWSNMLAAQPELDGRRRESVSWLWDRVGRFPAQAWWGTTIYVEHERHLRRVQKDGRRRLQRLRHEIDHRARRACPRSGDREPPRRIGYPGPREQGRSGDLAHRRDGRVNGTRGDREGDIMRDYPDAEPQAKRYSRRG